jgi:polysaccharide deacetylase family protein (PEP-CTERM system associated)
MLNALTIDVEDYFQVHAFSHIIRYEDWDKYESRVERNTHRILNILADLSTLRTPNSLRAGDPYGPEAERPTPSLSNSNIEHRTLNVERRTPVRATFFCLGWIAERYPQLIKEIQAQGHEIACHGYAHRLIYHQSKEEFKEDIHKAKAILENITGREIIGYRAPSYSITEKSKWALDVLAEEGFKYDSSIFPIQHDFYGIFDAPRFPFLVRLNGSGNPEFKPLLDTDNDPHRTLNVESCFLHSTNYTPNSELRTPNTILEFPLSTVRVRNFNLPISGGGYFRLFPYFMFKKGLKRINQIEGQPFIFYLHPWELDSDQPRIREVGPRSRFRHYININKTEGRFKKLLGDFNFSPLKDLLSFAPPTSPETQFWRAQSVV